MRSLLSLFVALLKTWFRSKSGIFFSFLFPVMLLFIFSTVFGGQDAGTYTLYLQNKDYIEGEPSELSKEFINGLKNTNTFNIVHIEENVNLIEHFEEDTSFESMKRGLIIPEGFHEKSINKSVELRAGVIKDTLTRIGENFEAQMKEEERQEFTRGMEEMEKWSAGLEKSESAEVFLIASEGDQAAPIVKGTISGVVNTFNQKIIGVEDSAVEISSRAIESKDLEAVDYYLPAYIAAFIMANGIIGVTSTVTEYRRNGVLKRLAATPLTKTSWILANILQQTVLAFLLTLVMVLLAVIFFNVQVYPGIYAIILIFTGAVAFSSVGIVLGGLIKDVEAATGAGNAIAFPMMFLSGAFWSVEMMPQYLQVVAKFLPLYHFHQGLIQIMILQNTSEAFLSFLIIFVFAIVFVILALKTTRWKEL